MRTLQIVVILIYVAACYWIANNARRQGSTLKDYLCPSMGPWTIALTGFATAFSTSTLVVGAGFGYQYGASVLWFAVPQAFGLAVMFLLFSAPMYDMRRKLGSLTVSEFLGARFKSDKIRGWAAIILFVFCVGNLIVIYRSLGLVVAQAMGIPYWVAVVVGGILAAFYTFYGGQLAVAQTDVLQGWLMTGGVLILFPIALSRVGGLSELYLKLGEISPQLTSSPGNFQIGILLGMVLVFSVGMLGQPQILYRTMFIRSKKDIPTIALVSFFVSLVACYIAFHCGMVGKVLIPTELATSDLAMPTLIISVLNPVLAAVLVTAMCAAAMSTADSVLIMASSAITRDIYQKFINKEASDDRVKKLSGILALVLGAIGTIWALYPPSWFLFLMAFVWAVWAATYMFPFLYGLYWRGTTTNGVFASMVLGPLTAVIWKQMGQPFHIHPLFPALLVAGLTIPIVSSFTPKLPDEFLNELFDK